MYQHVVKDSKSSVTEQAEWGWLLENINQRNWVGFREDFQEDVLQIVEQKKKAFNERLTALSSAPSRAERREMVSRMREMYRLTASCFASPLWQSPPVWGPQESGRYVELFVDDYRRESSLEMKKYEAELYSVFYKETFHEDGGSLLVSSGASALSLALDYFRMRFGGNFTTAIPLEIYHGSSELTDISSPLREGISMKKVDVRCVEVSTNAREILSPCFATLLEQARESNEFVLIDATNRPLSQSELQQIRSHKEVPVLILESLLKLHQYGLELTNAGCLTYVGPKKEEVIGSLNWLRARNGTSISDYGVYALPPLCKSQFQGRVERVLAANKALLTAMAELTGESFGGEHFEYAQLKFNWSQSPFVSVSYAQSEKSFDDLKNFFLRVKRNLREVGADMIEGASYGFQQSRMYLHYPFSKFAEPWMRISVGAEPQYEVELIAEALILSC